MVSRDSVRPKGSASSKVGLVIILTSLVLAAAIVGLGFLIAAQRRADAVRQRQIDERLEQLRAGEAE